MKTAQERFDEAGGVCEKCGSVLVPVNSLRHLKWHECICALNTSGRCSGTELHWRNWPGDETLRKTRELTSA